MKYLGNDSWHPPWPSRKRGLPDGELAHPSPPVRPGGTPRNVTESGPKGVHTRRPRGARVTGRFSAAAPSPFRRPAIYGPGLRANSHPGSCILPTDRRMIHEVFRRRQLRWALAIMFYPSCPGYGPLNHRRAGGLRRRHLPRTLVSRGKEKGRSCSVPSSMRGAL
jgi:hypothetical protein